ncbi:MAG: hypothetical protein ACRDYX_17735 [Egibacteraceae bacterium]
MPSRPSNSVRYERTVYPLRFASRTQRTLALLILMIVMGLVVLVLSRGTSESGSIPGGGDPLEPTSTDSSPSASG